MFDNVNLKAVVGAASVGFIFPYFVSFWFKVSFLGDVKQPDIDVPSADYTLAYFMLFVCGPLASGAVSALFSIHQPILHAVLAALIGWVFYAWLGAGFLVGTLFVVLGVVGATCWKKFNLDR